MDSLTIKYIKSCRGIFYSYDNKQILDARDYFRDNILQSIKNVQISHYNKINDKKSVYYGFIPHTKTYIRNIKWHSNSGYNEVKYLLNGTHNNYICPVTSEKYNSLSKQDTLPQYYTSIINGNSPEKGYLDKINGNLFYYEDNKYVILPDMLKYPISKEDLISFTDNSDISNIYNKLYSIYFILFIKNENIRSIYDINTLLLEDIKHTIIKFYKNIFNFDNNTQLDTNKLNIYINSDTKYNFITIEFGLFNNYTDHQYFSFVQKYKLVKLDDIIHLLKNGNSVHDIVYYRRFGITDNNTDIFCKNVNPQYDLSDKCARYTTFNECKTNKCFWNNQSGLCETFNDNSKDILKKQYICKSLQKNDCINNNNCQYNNTTNKCYIKKKKKSYVLAKKVDFDMLNVYDGDNLFSNVSENDIVSYYAETEWDTLVYCKDFIVIKYNNKYYHITIKSITYDVLTEYDSIYNNYVDKLLSITNNEHIYSYNTDDVSYEYYIAKLPSYVEMTVTLLSDYKPLITKFFLERSNVYYNSVLPKIKSGMIDNTLVISLIYLI